MLAETLGLTSLVRSIPIVDPVVSHTVGLVCFPRELMTAAVAELVTVARKAASGWSARENPASA